MAMNGFTAMMAIFIVFAIGDYVSSKTRALVSLMFVAAVLFLIGFQIGLFPADPETGQSMFHTSALLTAGGVLIAYLITHMGTLVGVKEFIAQWKTVVIGCASMFGIGLIMMLVAPLFIDRVWAVASAPVVAGGVVAALIMGERATELGFPEVAAFLALFVAMQGLIGFPIMSSILRRESKMLKVKFAAGERSVASASSAGEKKKLLPQLPEGIRNSPNALMAKLGIVAVIAVFLADLTAGWSIGGVSFSIHRFVMCLILGVVAKEIGFLDDNIMTKANTFGFAMAAILVVIYASLAFVSVADLIAMAYPMFICFLLGIIAMVIFSPLVGRLIGVPFYLSIAIGISCIVGFPGTFIISNEVAKSMGSSEEEQKYILDSILPKMLVAGFTTVTVGSVVMAGFMVGMF